MTIERYKKHAGGSAVIVMLKGLIKDAQQLEKDAIADENAAVTESRRFQYHHSNAPHGHTGVPNVGDY